MQRIYADHAATTPVRDEAVAAMLPYLGELGYNPSSVHAEGRAARAALDDARSTVARALGARPREIVFTNGGTEADNLALIGVARASAGPRRVVTSAIEHPAVLRAVDALRADGFEVTLVPVDASGVVDAGAFIGELERGACVASLMLANNELGTVQPVARVAAAARARGIVMHTDAIQAPGRLAFDVEALGVDLLALSAHKFYGPKGIGVLYVRAGTALEPLVLGGGQEFGLRSGTENVAGIVGMARALELAVAERPVEAERLHGLRDAFEAGVLEAVSGVEVNGDRENRLPNVSSLAFEGVQAAELVMRLDLDGVAASAGSACAAGAVEPSHVLAALGKPATVLEGSVRFSFGRRTSEQDVARLAKMLPATVAALRVAGPVLGTGHCGPVMGRAEERF